MLALSLTGSLEAGTLIIAVWVSVVQRAAFDTCTPAGQGVQDHAFTKGKGGNIRVRAIQKQ